MVVELWSVCDFFTKQKLQNIFWIHAATCGLYYKHIVIVNDDYNIVNKWRVSRSDDPKVVIYDGNMFIIKATWSSYLNIYRRTSHRLPTLLLYLFVWVAIFYRFSVSRLKPWRSYWREKGSVRMTSSFKMA